MDITRFSIIGSGYFVKLFDAEHTLYKHLKVLESKDLNQFLFDNTSFEKQNIINEVGLKYKSFYYVVPSKTYVVYCLDYFTRLEVRREKYKVTKIMFRDLFGTDFLFPPEYAINKTEFKNDGLVVMENDKGNYGSATVSGRLEHSNELTFETLFIPEINQNFVQEIKWKEQKIEFKKLDTLNFGSLVFI